MQDGSAAYTIQPPHYRINRRSAMDDSRVTNRHEGLKKGDVLRLIQAMISRKTYKLPRGLPPVASTEKHHTTGIANTTRKISKLASLGIKDFCPQLAGTSFKSWATKAA